MTDATIADSLEPAIGSLRAGFRGELIQPGDEGYDEARKIWNGSVSRFPALIARCAGVADVIEAVRFARDTGLVVAVRGGIASPVSRFATAGWSWIFR